MNRLWPCLLLLAAAQPAAEGEPKPPYYGPMKPAGGVLLSYKYGYRDGVAKDGAWRIDASTRTGDAIDMALYRAAERAKSEGYRYVFFLGGSASRSPAYNSATVYARPSREAVAPEGCRSRKSGTCYTADVAEVMRVLGGPGGTQPGVAVVDHRDQYGREVRLSGYGTGGVVSASGALARSSLATISDGRVVITGGRKLAERYPAPAAAAPAVVVPAPVVVAVAPPAPARAFPVALVVARPVMGPSEAEIRFAQAMRANQPIRGREPRLGWTISD